MSKSLFEEHSQEATCTNFRPSRLQDEGCVGHNGNQASTRTEERPDFAENVLDRAIDVGKGNFNIDDLLQPICALLNSGGGVLEIKMKDYVKSEPPQKQWDKVWQKLEAKLESMVNPSSYFDVFDRVVKEDQVFLFIKAPDHWCTMEYNLFLAGDTKVAKASFHQTLELLSHEPDCNVSLEELPSLPEIFRHKEKLNFPESKTMQFTYVKSSNPVLHDNSSTQCEKVLKQTSAFANVNGGIILVGVTDDGIVLGQNLDSKEKVEQRVESIIVKMEWGCIPRRKTHWDVEFFPVQDTEDSFVIAIYIAGMKGGVFTKCPKSYELRPGKDGEQTIPLLTFDEWKQRVSCGKHMLQIKKEREALKLMTKRFDTLSVSKGVLLTLKGSIGGIRESFFKVAAGCPISPKGFEENLPEVAKSVVRKIQEMSSSVSSRALVVAAPSWHACIKRGEVPESDVICDLLLFNCQLGGLHLFTLCDTAETNAHLLSYSHNTAKALKKALVTDGGCHEKLYISYHPVPCRTPTSVEIGQPCPDNRYPEEYKLEKPPEKLDKILESLVIVLAAVPSVLSNKQGICFFNLLTKEQFQLLYQEIDRFKELWITGAAGTGKTLVAVEFMKELRRRHPSLKKEEILYVCENKGLRDQIRKLDVCKALSRKRFLLGRKGVENPFSTVKHIIMDGLENFRDENLLDSGNWLNKARKLVRQHSTIDPGYLWLFIDKSQINHSKPTGIPDETEQQPWFVLTKVIRNSRRIMEYASRHLHEKRNVNIEIGHDFEGEGVSLIIYERHSSQISALREVLLSLYNEGYSAGDICLIYGDKWCIPESLQVELDLGQIANAEENDSNHIVVSTFHKYSGLERPVVVLVNVRESLPSGAKNAIYCCATRAMVKLIDLREGYYLSQYDYLFGVLFRLL